MGRMSATETPTLLQDRLAENVKRELKSRGMTQGELASRLEITDGQLSDMLKGRNRLQLYWAERFAEALSISEPADLLQPVL